jgi:hypothetical protein
MASQQMTEWEKDIEFIAHLAYILTHCPPEHAAIQPVAGATLSGCLSRSGSKFTSENLAVIKGLILAGVGSASEEVSRFSSNCVSCLMRVLARRERKSRALLARGAALPVAQMAWPELLPALASGFDSSSPGLKLVTLRLTGQLFEDVPSWFVDQGLAVTDSIVTRVMAVAKSQPAASLEYAAQIIEQVSMFAPESFPTTVKATIADWINLLQAAIRNHGNPKVRKVSIDALGKLMQAASRESAPHISQLVDIATKAANDPDPMVSAEAICFWELYIEFIRTLKPAVVVDAPGSPAPAAAVKAADVQATYLFPLFPTLLPLLVQKLRITDLDAADLPVEDDSAVPSAGSAVGGVAAAAAAAAGVAATGWSADEADNGLGFVTSGEFTPRKAATSQIQELAINVGEPFAEAMWPYVSSLLLGAPPAGMTEWECQEMALVMLDASVTFCADFYKDRLPPLSAGLCTLASSSPRPLVRRGALAVLGKMSGFAASTMSDEQIAPLLAALGRGLKDKSAEPQAAALRGLANMFRELDHADRIQAEWLASAASIAVGAMPSMSLRGRRAATNLLHAVAECGDGSHMTPELTAAVLNAILAWWEQRRALSKSVLDASIQLAIECTTTVVEVSQRAAEPFAGRIMGLCSELVTACDEMERGATEAGEESNGLTNAARAMDLAGGFLSCALPQPVAAAWLKSNPFLTNVASVLAHTDDFELLEACVGVFGEAVAIAPAEVMAQVLPVWSHLVSMLHPDYQGASTQIAWALARIIDTLGSTVAAGLPQLMERVFDLIRGRYASHPEADGTGLSLAFNANLGLLMSSVSKVAPALVNKAVETPGVMVNWLACATLNSDFAEKLQVTTAIGKCLTAVPQCCRMDRVGLAIFCLVSSYATLPRPDQAQVASVRTVCSALVHLLRANTDEATWGRESRQANNAIVRGRVNDMVCSVVLPIGESPATL